MDVEHHADEHSQLFCTAHNGRRASGGIFLKRNLFTIGLIVTVFATSCGSNLPDSASVEVFRSQIAQLQSQLADVSSKLGEAELKATELAMGVDDLTSTLDRSSYEDWRDIMLSAKLTAADLENTARDLESLIEEAATAAR